MSEETVQMKFPEDKHYDGKLLYKKDEVSDVPVSMKERWLKRGGVLVKKEQPKEDVKVEVVEDQKPEDVKPEEEKRKVGRPAKKI